MEIQFVCLGCRETFTSSRAAADHSRRHAPGHTIRVKEIPALVVDEPRDVVGPEASR